MESIEIKLIFDGLFEEICARISEGIARKFPVKPLEVFTTESLKEFL